MRTLAAGVVAAGLLVTAPGQATPDGWQPQRTVVTGSAAQDLRPLGIAVNGFGRSYVLYTCGQGAVCGRYQRVDGRLGAWHRLFSRRTAPPVEDIDVALGDTGRATIVWTSDDGAVLARRASRQGWTSDAVEVGPPGASGGREQILRMQTDGDLEILWRPPEPWVWSYRQLRADDSLTDAPVRVEGQVFDVDLVDQTLAVVAVDQAQTLRFSKLSDGAVLGEPTVVDEGTDRIVPSAAVSMEGGGDAVVVWRAVVGNQSTVSSRHLPAVGDPSETYRLEGPRRGPYSLDLVRTGRGLRAAYMVGGELWGRRLTDQGASAGEATLLQRRYFSQPARLHPMGGRVVFFHAKRGGRAPVLVRSWDGRRAVLREGPVLTEPEYRDLSGDRSALVVAQAGRHLAAAVGWRMPRTVDWPGWSRVKSVVNDPRAGS